MSGAVDAAVDADNAERLRLAAEHHLHVYKGKTDQRDARRRASGFLAGRPGVARFVLRQGWPGRRRRAVPRLAPLA